MIGSICLFSEPLPCTSAHTSKLPVMESQRIHQQQFWAWFVHRGSPWAVCEICSPPQQEKYQPHIWTAGEAALIHSQTVHEFSMKTQQPILQTSSPVAANDASHSVSFKSLMDVIFLVNTEALTRISAIQRCATKAPLCNRCSSLLCFIQSQSLLAHPAN